MKREIENLILDLFDKYIQVDDIYKRWDDGKLSEFNSLNSESFTLITFGE